MIEAILWDNDGVLVDTEHLYFQATREAMADVSVALTEQDYIDYLLRDSRGAWHLLEEAGVPTARIDELKAQRNERYGKLLATETRIIDGVRETLEKLHGDYAMGIVTSSRPDHFEIIHAHSGLLAYFDFVLAGGDYARSKPAPDPYLAGIDRVGVPADRCMVIEDSERGLQSALAAELRCIVIPSGMTQGGDFTGATSILEDVRSVPSTIAAL
jgi:HAD superfamily hydrolase (TIGR01509 family)